MHKIPSNNQSRTSNEQNEDKKPTTQGAYSHGIENLAKKRTTKKEGSKEENDTKPTK